VTIVTLQIDNDRIRFYTDDVTGTYYPSVTTILGFEPSGKQGIEIWKEKTINSKEILDYKSVTGTLVHYRVANFCASEWGMPRIPIDFERDSETTQIIQNYYDKVSLPGYYGKSVLQDVQAGFACFLEWFDEWKPKPAIHEIGRRKGLEMGIHPEFHILHDILCYAGSTDLPCSIEGENWVIDLKFNERMSPKYKLQVTAYRLGLLHMFSTVKFSHLGILNLKTSDMRPMLNIFEPTAALTSDWLRILGGFYYHYRNEAQLKSSVHSVFSYLESKNVEIVTNMRNNPFWKDSIGIRFK
jgi:hypothetical protein